jgi:hypothetical protein
MFGDFYEVLIMETKKLPEKFDCLAPDNDEAIKVNGFWKIK